MKKILTALPLCLFFGACAIKTPDVTTYRDDISGLSTDLLSENLLDTKAPTREMIWLNASRIFKNQREFSYYLEVHYAANAETGYLDIRPGQTLVLNVDGQELKFYSNGSFNTRKVRKEILGEDAVYEVTGEAMRMIADAKKVKVRVTGQNGLVEREFAPENFERFKKFVSSFVK